MTYNEIEQWIGNNVEQVYFFGAYSEDTVRNDLQLRKAMDIRSGGQTNNLGEKKSIYIQHFNRILGDINFAINWVQSNRPQNSEFISRCERCKSQVKRLLDIVRDF